MWRILTLSVSFAVSVLAAETASTNALGNSQQQILEKRFQSLLDNSVFNGRWCLVEKGRLTEEYQDKYTVQGATKSGKEVWIVYARVQYAGKDLTVPIPVQVKWAGDTPVITLDKVSVPGLGTYSARVLIYGDTYAGTWSASDHGGMLHGIIEKAVQPNAKISQPKKPTAR